MHFLHSLAIQKKRKQDIKILGNRIEINNDIGEDICAEVITEAEGDVSNEITKYESVVDSTAWEGGDGDGATENMTKAEEVDMVLARKLNKLEDSSVNDFNEQPYEPFW